MVSVRASCLLHLASPKAAPCRAVPPRRTSLGAARGAPPTERCGAGAQRRRGSSWKLIFYRTPRKKIREANYGDNHRGLRAFPWKSGVARDYLTPCSNLCGRRARAVVAWHLGSPPGPKTLGFWLWFGVAATESWSYGCCGWVPTPTPPVPPKGAKAAVQEAVGLGGLPCPVEQSGTTAHTPDLGAEEHPPTQPAP